MPGSMAKLPFRPQLRTFSLLYKPRTTFRGVSLELPSDTPIEEEVIPGYDPRSYFPVEPGYVFNQRFEALSKLGWGSGSTVWLVRDLHRWRFQSERYLTLKVGNCDFKDKEAASHEARIEDHIAHANPHHDGCNYVRTWTERFEEQSAHGTHIFLAYEPMREPLGLFQNRCRNQRLPLGLLKGYVKLLLKGLDYLHSECNVIHTDLKVDNMLVTFENSSVLQDFVQAQPSNPMPRKVKNRRTIYLSHNDFGPLRSFYILPKITDFGLAHHQGTSSVLNRHPIQPDEYRAPEVILGAGWTYSADIWNLGLLSPAAHLAEMIALLGPPPAELKRRERDGLNWNWAPAVHNDEGKLCSTASDWFGGPFFDENGEFMHNHLIPHTLKIEDTVKALDGEQKDQFLSFARKMLQWLPDDRKTAKGLIEDPWLSDDSIRRGV
ncbi:CMGC protein kinase [Aspergillus sclerotioniger CBS 115572]|uniref:non-specific serine/threonine protein kinase n=1 Tax=Aspergillus sclerotioniger CBS 115572 TaxID=1450535 RepID=A0A317X6Z7_9EURO|nr:CMGC protein kinase [Aspergillus sclerotioniger CBS 115572]PWY93951.1 CMGC protein kinase [Aspergillus sclerotioniger CBS 115572]